MKVAQEPYVTLGLEQLKHILKPNDDNANSSESASAGSSSSNNSVCASDSGVSGISQTNQG